ncbi:MAG TPA: AAA family ATPase [Anaerolineae bacterium]|nr:AAA family ATPase [Anaerolineae bacterium]HXW01202.1 AAA family ATPase [Anaerolineae bacterium]
MKFLADAVAFTFEADEAPSGFQALTELPLVIMVGLTGVGKSTVLELLSKNGLNFTLLPNRRQITDQIIIASLQAEAGQIPYPVSDRVERFEYTARYRAKFPGGMAHALSRLVINPAQIKPLLIFDGLRGLNEVQHAIVYFPLARFIVLDAPDTIRLNRLLKREDVFDTTGAVPRQGSLASQNLMAALLAVPNIEAIFSEEQLRQVAKGTRFAQIPVDEVIQKVSIIVKERHNYDSNAARVYLTRTFPAQRVLVVNTATLSAQAVAQRMAKWLETSSK